MPRSMRSLRFGATFFLAMFVFSLPWDWKCFFIVRHLSPRTLGREC